jgi:hypothetical protein
VRLVAAIGLDASERFPSSWKSIVAALVVAAAHAGVSLLLSTLVLVLAALPPLGLAILGGWLRLGPTRSGGELLLLVGCAGVAGVSGLIDPQVYMVFSPRQLTVRQQRWLLGLGSGDLL